MSRYGLHALLDPDADADVIAAVEAAPNKSAFVRAALCAFVRERPALERVEALLGHLAALAQSGAQATPGEADDTGLAETLGGLAGL